MKRKEFYLFIIRDTIKFNDAANENINPNKAIAISFFIVVIDLFFLFLVYCKYNIIKRDNDKSI